MRAEEMPIETWADDVRREAQAIAADGSEAVFPTPGLELARMRRAGLSPLEAACQLAASERQRRFGRGDYERQERRVADYLVRRMPELGAGFDPVGFLIASHAELARRLAEAEGRDPT